MELSEALAIANDVIETRIHLGLGEPVAIAEDKTIETDSQFVFFDNTVAFLETRSMVHALAGSGPIAVGRQTGSVRVLDSSRPWEEQVE